MHITHFFNQLVVCLGAAEIEGAQDLYGIRVGDAGCILALLSVGETHLVYNTGGKCRRFEDLSLVFVDEHVCCAVRKIEAANALVL